MTLEKSCTTSWRDSNVQRRDFQGDYTTASLTLVFQMECQVRALQMKDPGAQQKSKQ